MKAQKKDLLHLNHLKSVIDNLDDAILLEDQDRKIAQVNPAFCSVFSIAAEPNTLIGKDCEELSEFAKECFANPSEFSDLVNNILALKAKVTGKRLAMKNGSVVELSYNPWIIDEVVKGHMWKYRDVTKKVIKENDRRREQVLFRKIIKEAPVAIALFDKNDDIIEQSQAWQSNPTITVEYFNALQPYKEKIQKGELVSSVITSSEANKTVYYNVVVSSWFTNEKEFAGYFVVANQISELIIEKERALEESKMKSQFLANMSHEIRTPMNGILGMLEMLRMTNLNKDQADFVSVISNSADSLLTILNDVLDFSKMEAGKMELSPTWFNLYESLVVTTKTFQSSAKKKGLALNLDFKKNRNIRIFADPVRLRQVTTNLISNAIKFTNDGSVTLTVDVSAESPSDNKCKISFKIKDTGIGISAEAQARIFSPFEQADGSTSRKFGGTGLGLTISNTLVSLMGGQLDLKSQINMGTEFSFDLEFQCEFEKNNEMIDVSSIALSPTPGIDFTTLNILIAEDNLVNQQVLRLMLEKIKTKFTFVENGELVLQKLSESKFDLLLLDCQMPVLDGYSTAQKIREQEKINKIQRPLPIVALTAHAFESEKRKCFECGMNDFVTKPISLNDLKAVITRQFVSSSVDEKSFNQNQIGQLKSLIHQPGTDASIGHDFCNKLFSSFEKSAPDLIQKIKSSSQQKNMRDVHLSAHSLKSVFGNLGLQSLQRACQSLETTEDVQQIAILIDYVESNYTLHFAEVKRLLLVA